MKPITLAISLGDPGGIGPEVVLKSLKSLKKMGQLKQVDPILIGSFASLERSDRFVRSGLNLRQITRDISFPESERFLVGKISPVNGRLAIDSVARAVDLCLGGACDALVTAPLNKAAVRFVLPGFDGHTDYLKKRSRAKHVAMMFSAGKLRMTLVTMHVSLRDVSRSLSRKSVKEKIKLTYDALKGLFGIKKPKIGVAALNPHGSEFGSEEERIIAPAVKSCQKRIQGLQGPIPGDEIFRELWEGKWDGVVAMYHDQGLAPFKMVAFRTGVNLTVGLPFVRTSPDHGTAFDIAYQNKADHLPMQSAIELAVKLARK